MSERRKITLAAIATTGAGGSSFGTGLGFVQPPSASRFAGTRSLDRGRVHESCAV